MGSVCPSVCVISTAQTDGPILMKLSTYYLQYICSIRFSPILKIQIDDVMAAIIAVFESGTLTVAILLRFSSNFRIVNKSQPPVCYLKSAKSVDNFGSYG